MIYHDGYREDSYLPGIFRNQYTGQGTHRDRSLFTEILPGQRLSQLEIDNLYESQWMIQNLIDIISNECTRAWIEFALGGKKARPSLLSDFNDYLDKLVDDVGDSISVRDIFNEALKDERRTGGAIIYMHIDDGRDPHLPVNEDRIKTIAYLQEFDRWAVSPEYRPDLEPDLPQSFIMNSSKSVSWDLSKPTHYRLNIGKIPDQKKDLPETMGLIHRSRVLRFGGAAKLGYRARQKNQGWGYSVVECLIRPLIRYQSTLDHLAYLIPEALKKTWKIEGLWERLASGEDIDKLRQRVAEMSMMESLYKYRVIDKSKEEIGETSSNLEGFYRSAEMFLDECVAASNLPRTLLLGVSPQGKLGVSGQSEQLDLSRTISSYQADHITRPLNRIFNLLWKAKDSPTKGKPPKDFGWKYVNPYPMTELDKANLFSIYCGTFGGLINSQVLTPDEVAKSVFGGSEISFNIVLDTEKRDKMAKMYESMNNPGEGDYGGDPVETDPPSEDISQLEDPPTEPTQNPSALPTDQDLNQPTDQTPGESSPDTQQPSPDSEEISANLATP